VAVNAAWLVYFISVAITCAVIGSTVAFSAATATASYVIPLVARHTSGRKTFVPAQWNLGRFSLPLAIVASAYISFLFAVWSLPPLYPVTAQMLNYAPICIGAITIISVVGWIFPQRGGGRQTLVQGTDQDHHGRTSSGLPGLRRRDERALTRARRRR
jgi:hypothetical protein